MQNTCEQSVAARGRCDGFVVDANPGEVGHREQGDEAASGSGGCQRFDAKVLDAVVLAVRQHRLDLHRCGSTATIGI